MNGHGASGHVDGAGGGEKRSVRLWPEVTIGSFHVAVGEGVAGRTVEAQGSRRGGHPSVAHARRSRQYQYLIGWSVAGAVCPGFTLPVEVGYASLLHQ